MENIYPIIASNDQVGVTQITTLEATEGQVEELYSGPIAHIIIREPLTE